MNNYGAASRYDFDNPQKWVTVNDVPLLDEHEMTNENGEPIAYVGKPELEQIAHNNNKRVIETGDPATLILGHTSDDPKADEKPAKGFAVNYKVKPFKRDPKTGQVIFAIHADYKVRPQNAHIIEEFPRRSVELWWHKKELDPIALLGGTTPERDLSVVLRKARLKHVAVLGSSVPERDLSTTIRFRRHGNDVIESYNIESNKPLKYSRYEHLVDDAPPCPKCGGEGHHARTNGSGNVVCTKCRNIYTDPVYGHTKETMSNKAKYSKNGKVEKVMHEFKEGELHSGSKKGPKVKSREQAIAIAMNEAGKSKKYSEETHMTNGKSYPGTPKCTPADSNKVKYAMGEGMDDDETLHDPSDGGGEYDGMGQEEEGSGIHDEGMGDEAEQDPTVAKVFASKQWQEMSAKIDMIVQALEGADQQPGMEEPRGIPGNGPGTPPPSPQEMAGQQPNQEERMDHGEEPVQFAMSTGFPGPSSTNVPNMNTTTGKRYSRNDKSSTANNGATMTNKKTQTDPQLIKMSRHIQEMQLKLSRSNAKELINQLEKENIIFGDTAEEHEAGKQEELEYLALLSEEDQQLHADQVIRRRYKRRAADPGNLAMPGVGRYIDRNPLDVSGEEEFEPETPMEASNYADLIAVRKLSRTDAIKAIKKMRNGR